jgi:hypothetical protein
MLSRAKLWRAPFRRANQSQVFWTWILYYQFTIQALTPFSDPLFSLNRFAEKIGELSNDEIDQIKRSITLILDIESEHCEE